MLKKLYIKNYVLIEELEIKPSSKLNMITGETGAGKSIMLGAIGLLMGKRADSKVMNDSDKKCVVEGVFDVSDYKLKKLFDDLDLDYEKITILRREIKPNGSSRAFVNDTPVNLGTLQKISLKLIDIHSQHDTLLLGSNSYQLRILDVFAQNHELVKRYQKKYNSYKAAEKAYQDLLEENNQIKKEFEFDSHQLQELSEANLDDLNLKELEQELEKLEHAEQIKSQLNLSLEYLSRSEFAVEDLMKSVQGALNDISNYGHQFQELKERVESSIIELNDIVFEIEREEHSLVFDSEKINLLKERLDQVYTLQQKHKVDSPEALIEIRDNLQAKVDKVLNFDEDLEKALQAKEEAKQKLDEVAVQLSENRQKVMPKIEKKINAILSDLGMPNAQLAIERQAIEADATGIDLVHFLFSANKGIAPDSLKNVASGGEFSRLMLAIKYILAAKTHLPTIIFDEIDTGISGEVAMKVGEIMREMSIMHQVVAITHLPQMAAKGDYHYFVYKDDTSEKTISKIKKLDVNERISEVAEMIGGASPTETAYQSARELLML